VTFYQVDDTTLSSMNADTAKKAAEKFQHGVEEVTVPMQTLAEICQAHCTRQIDFMNIDVEGWEENVIRSGDWNRFRPVILVVEACIPCMVIEDWDHPEQIQSHHTWEPLLLSAGYEFAYFDGLNRFYVRREDRHLIKRFSVPISIHDCYIPAEMTV